MNVRNKLDQVPFLTDGGMETVLIFKQGIDLPSFSSIVMMETVEGRQHLRRYWEDYIRIAEEARLGMVFESASWRASRDWAPALGYDWEKLVELNRRSVEFVVQLASEVADRLPATIASGCIGPRGDGYRPEGGMTAAEAAAYHAPQIEALVSGGCEVISALTMNDVSEASGIALAAGEAGIPSVISFTVETDGCLPSGISLEEAIHLVDADPESRPLYYMINCAHPTHFIEALPAGAPWLERVRGVRANASRCSHAELDNATELDEGDPADLATHFEKMRDRLPRLAVHGGCCGTDHAHIDAIARVLSSAPVG